MESKFRHVFDIETLPKVFTATFIDYDTDEVRVFEISRRRNDLEALRDFLYTQVRVLIGFNCIHFDNPVIGWLLDQPFTEFDDPELIANRVYKVAQLLINSDDFGLSQDFKKYGKLGNIQVVDVFLHWSRMLRISKKLSLKFFAVNLGMNVQEMPIHHTQEYLTNEEIDMVISYNINDVRVTKRLAQHQKEEINLRVWILGTYNIPCLSWDAPKIASELLLKSYCEKTGADPYETKKRKYLRPVIPLKNVVPDIRFKTEFFKQIYKDICNSVDSFKGEYLYRNPSSERLKLSYGVGGLHSINKNQKYFTGNGWIVKTSDVASLYPTFIIEYGYVSPELGVAILDVYKEIKAERLVAKKNKDKVKDTFLKLVLNSFSGLLDNQHSWLYAPEQALALRLHGQLLLSRVIEECGLAGIDVISVNTDGVEVRLHESQLEIYDKLLADIEKEFRVVFESDTYSSIRYLTVNDYIAITESGKIKVKGLFVPGKFKEDADFLEAKPIIDGSNEFNIIAKALINYYANGIPVEKTIKNCGNIQDFCKAQKIDRSYTVYYDGKKQQQLNRYFVAKSGFGKYLYKQKNEKSTLENVLKETPICIVNGEIREDTNFLPVNYQWYISKCYEIIDLFDPKQLSLFGSPASQMAA